MEDTTPVKDSFLQQLLECPVCLEICQTPVFMCVNGHNVCSDCKKNLRVCPQCRVRGPLSIRNRALETLSDQVLTVPCKFQPHGCGVKRKRVEDLESHYPKCKFQPYPCSFAPACDYIGNGRGLYDHMKDKHPKNVRPLRGITCLSFKTDSNSSYPFVFKWEGKDEYEYFVTYLKYIAKTSLFYFFFRYIGTPENASKFKIRMRITSEDKKSAILVIEKEPLHMDEDFLISEKAFVIRGGDFKTVEGNQRKICFSVASVTYI